VGHLIKRATCYRGAFNQFMAICQVSYLTVEHLINLQATVHDITFVLTSRSGLGHLRRATTIASALRLAAPSVTIELLTNAEPSGIPAQELSNFSRVRLAERADMASALTEVPSRVAVLDTIVVPGIGACPQRKVLILRETPADRLSRFDLPPGQHWDCVLLPNPVQHWRPELAVSSMPEVQSVGWIYRPTGVRSGQDTPTGLLVATGGGGNESTRGPVYRTIDSVLRQVRQHANQSISVYQAIGARAAGAQILNEADHVIDPGGDLNIHFRTADAVISTAGYNSILELASTDTPAMLLGIPRSIDDQVERARLWGPALGFFLQDNDIDRAAQWLHRVLSTRARRTPVALGPSGEHLAASAILRLL